jgi:hypothetical protein
MTELSSSSSSSRPPQQQKEAKEDVKEEEKPTFSSSFGWTDEQFQNWLTDELQKDPLHSEYPDIFQAAPKCITKWRQRYRGDRVTWKRIFQKDRVIKEFIEAVPIIDAVRRLVVGGNDDDDDETKQTTAKKYTIIDLASGKGYLSMFLSELLPPSRVEKFVLMDKAWPQHDRPPQPHHISWTHIYGTTSKEEKDGEEEEKRKRYYDTWPIPLTTSKQDLKKGNQRRGLQERFLSDGPVIMLAVHLCGTLSLKAVQFFNDNPNIRFFCLKPCCLPGMVHAERDEVFELGKHHSFEAKRVCMPGKWIKNRWRGPPRAELKSYFQTWADNLFLGIDDHDAKKIQKTVMVQSNGGYQNEFLFAERLPETRAVWEALMCFDGGENYNNDEKPSDGNDEEN